MNVNSNSAYGPVWFVVSDLNTSGIEDDVDSQGNSIIPPPTVLSDNQLLVPLNAITVDGIGGLKWQVTVRPAANQVGRAVITIIFTDSDSFNTSAQSERHVD